MTNYIKKMNETKNKYNVFYVPYKLNRNVNYRFLFCLYGIAKRENKEARIKNVIVYKKLEDLQQQIENYNDCYFSLPTIGKALGENREEYKDFFTIATSPEENRIILNNNFLRSIDKKNNVPFVRLVPKLYEYLIEQNDNLLTMYVLFLLYYCGLGKGKTDSTAEQFLFACGYSTTSGSNKGKLCKYNQELSDKGIIRIEKSIVNGRFRNTYTFLLLE